MCTIIIGAYISAIHQQLCTPHSIVICVANNVYKNTKITGNHDCSTDNGGCDQLCVATDSGPECSCLPGYTIGRDTRTCSGIHKLRLYTSNKINIITLRMCRTLYSVAKLFHSIFCIERELSAYYSYTQNSVI